jgi:hypothetical protein
MSNPVSHEQLAMYMTPRELSRHELGDTYLTGEEPHEIMQRKLHEATKSGLADKIRSQGVQDPVHLYHNVNGTSTLTDGHHRLAVAQTMGKNTLIPVEHHDEKSGI